MSKDRTSSETMAHLAAEIMRDPEASALAKSLAGSVLSMVEPGREPGAEMASLAGQIMSRSHEYPKNVVSLAASILSQDK